MQEDPQQQNSSEGVSRRSFLTSTLAAGFALAVQPVAATMIRTDEVGLVAGEISIPVGKEEIPAYHAMPDKRGPFPVVLVVHEIFGVHEHIQDVCRRIARKGYLAIAPQLFARQGDVSKLKDISEIRPIVNRVPDVQVMKDLDGAVRWAYESGKGDIHRLAITGFCWGGRIVWLYAAHNPRLRAGAAWYGRLVGEPSELQPKHPVDVAAEIKVPVIGFYGGADEGIPAETIDRMRTALGSNPSDIIVYPGAPHAFFADYRPSYRKEFAEDGWNRMFVWFKEYGAA